MSGQHESAENLKMEINGEPYYVKSKGNVPYLYDIDTHDEVGYWSSKKGQYIMFSLYNKLMKEKYESQGGETASCSSESETMGSGLDSESQEEEEGESDSEESQESGSEEESQESGSEESQESDSEESQESDSEESQESEEGKEESEEESIKTKNKTSTHSLMFLFLILFVYLILQREFQSIHFDFIFLILINLMNTLRVFEMLNDE